MSGTLEFAIHTLVEKRLDMSIFAGKYRNNETGRAAYDPKILLMVLLAYSRGLISSRKIEQVCRENVVFMALACGQVPDHSTIAAFVSSMKDEILPLFRDVLLVCEEMTLLGGTMFALDGCKLPSNASKEWSGTLAELRKKKEKIETKVTQLLAEQIKTDRGQGKPPGSRASGASRQQLAPVSKSKGRRKIATILWKKNLQNQITIDPRTFFDSFAEAVGKVIS
jgi:transposase